jgi:hypothetical protein
MNERENQMTSDRQHPTPAPQAEELTDSELDTVAGAGPVPYPDTGSSGDTKNVSVSGNLESSSESSDGAEAGTHKGVVSGNNQGKSYTSSGSLNVKVEGKPIIPTLRP